jgi:hypothetical protein
MKFVIWGHKLHTHTHSYIHSAYNKAFEYLGNETYWVDAKDDLSSIDFSDAVFFVEGSVSGDIPIIKTCKYITHHLDTEKLTSSGIPYENILKLGNYLPREEVHEKVEDLAYWDNSTRTLYQCWGTDLLPHEIDIDGYVPFNPSRKTLNYVAMLYEQGPWWAEEFATLLDRDFGVEFEVFTQHVSHEDNIKLIRDSFLCPDFRSDWHLECGYIPCRMWKNISYGRITGTNSPFVKRALGDYVVFGGTPQTLYNNLLNAEQNRAINMKDAMMFVRDNHTFINRVNTILRFL